MAYQNNKNPHVWRYHMDEYQVYEPKVERAYPWHHQKGRVAFRTNSEEPISYVEVRETETENPRQRTRFGDQNSYESVDQEAEDFIQHEHKRMEMARLMSSMRDA
ncbi:hypothetical protein SESBI_25882 [Sesbania bispinosa]|nr:hypothetical protein SESBI_25882 [Sesbania bispinosa]